MDYFTVVCKCGGVGAPILYGFPTTAMVEHARSGLVALGGVIQKEFTHYCYTCNEAFTEEK